jgi:hypothetical protein
VCDGEFSLIRLSWSHLTRSFRSSNISLMMTLQMILILIYLSAAIGFTPGSSGTVHTINT